MGRTAQARCSLLTLIFLLFATQGRIFGLGGLGWEEGKLIRCNAVENQKQGEKLTLDWSVLFFVQVAKLSTVGFFSFMELRRRHFRCRLVFVD